MFNNLGLIAQERGQTERARDYFLRAKEFIDRVAPGSPVAAAAPNNLGDLEREMGNFDLAEKYLVESLAIKEKLGKDSLFVMSTLINLGQLAKDRKDFAGAESYYLRALKIRERETPGVQSSEILTDLAELRERAGDFATAETMYSQARQLCEKYGPGTVLHAETLAGLARIAVEKKLTENADALYGQALDVIESQASRLGGTAETRTGYRERHAHYYKNYIDFLIANKKPERAFEILERFRARTLLEMLTTGHIDISGGVDSVLLHKARMLRASINAKTDVRIRVLSRKHSEEELKTVSQEIEKLSTEYEETTVLIRSSRPTYSSFTEPVSLSLARIQQELLTPDTILLEYSLGEMRSYVFAVGADSLDVFELPKRSDIELQSRTIHELLTGKKRGLQREGEDRKLLNSALLNLSKIVVGPIASKMNGKRLLIVADGALQYIPFAMLPEPNIDPRKQTGLMPLLVNHEIVALPSASVLRVLREQAKQQVRGERTLAVLADPVFNDADARVGGRASADSSAYGSQKTKRVGPQIAKPEAIDKTMNLTRSLGDMGLFRDGAISLVRLPYTRREAEAIYAEVPQGSAMKALDFDASRATATSPELSRYRIVHFATHGLLNSEHPELSGLVLSLVDRDGHPQDGFLGLQDIYNLNLPADLVVLSACETGLGKEISGEGLIGLTRGFMYAGASRVVASLWKVSDVATAKLMAEFYRSMEQDHLAPAAALRQAQISMWKQKRWSDPYYWAAFQLQGEWK